MIYNAYESRHMQSLTGEALRPGGFELTERGAHYCGLSHTDCVLDIGCGRGATIGYLHKMHGICATGVDVSETLLNEARRRHPYGEFRCGSGMQLPFSDEMFDAAFAECTLSLMESPEQAIKEAARVIKEGSWMVVTDVYAKNPENIGILKKHGVNTCLRGLLERDLIQRYFEENGFEILLVEDQSRYLKEMMVKIIFKYGSMQVFWNKTGRLEKTCSTGCNFQSDLKACKPGYFFLIARKGHKNG